MLVCSILCLFFAGKKGMKGPDWDLISNRKSYNAVNMRQGLCLKPQWCKGYNATHESESSCCLAVEVGWGKQKHIKHNISFIQDSTGRRCFLPVPLYNNASFIITVAEYRRTIWRTETLKINKAQKIKKQSKFMIKARQKRRQGVLIKGRKSRAEKRGNI